MGYARALEKAWSDILNVSEQDKFIVKFLAEEYIVDLKEKVVFEAASNTPAKDFISILILHYIIQKLNLKNLPIPQGKWINFKQLSGGDIYYPVFRKRTIDLIIKKYSSNPDSLLERASKLNGRKSDIGDIGVIIEPFEGVPLQISLWKGDEELGPEVDILFDRSITQFFCTEDITVLAEIIAHSL